MTDLLKPLHNFVLVKRLGTPDRTPGGLLLPDEAKKKPLKGIVKAVGPGIHNESGQLIPIGIEPGQTIIFTRYGGTDVKVNNEDYLLMKDSEILARLVTD